MTAKDLYKGDDSQWHLSKTLNLGHLVSTILLVVMVITMVQASEQRLTKLETKQEAAADKVLRHEAEVRDEIQEIQIDLNQVSDRQESLRLELKSDGLRREEKLDKLIQHIMVNGKH